MDTTTKIAIFKGKSVRKTIHNNEWWFSIIDVMGALTQTDRPRKYWNDLKTKIIKEGYNELSDKIGQLKLPSADGKLYATDCANTETIFRIIHTITSPKAEPFKRWLAKVGYERIQEIEAPELATKKPPLSGFGDPTKVGSSLAYHPEIRYHIIVSMSSYSRGGDGICTRRTLDDKPGSLLKHPHVNKSIAYEQFSNKTI